MEEQHHHQQQQEYKNYLENENMKINVGSDLKLGQPNITSKEVKEDESEMSSLESLDDSYDDEEEEIHTVYDEFTTNDKVVGKTPNDQIKWNTSIDFQTTPDHATRTKQTMLETVSTHKLAPQDRGPRHNPILSPPFQLFSPTTTTNNNDNTTNSQRRRNLDDASTPSPTNIPYAETNFSRDSGPNNVSLLEEEIVNLVHRLNDSNLGKGTGSPLKSDDPVDLDLDRLRQKTNIMIQTLHTNYESILQLQNENEALKQQIQDQYQYQDPNQSPPPKIDESLDSILDSSDIQSSDTETNDTASSRHYLDPSDDYVRRTYPTVPKSPGTMFVTELLEHVELDVGHAAHLAQIMDRQWGTTNIK